MNLRDDFSWSMDWKTVEFDETLEVVSYSRGRSAANIDVKSTTRNDYYTVFLVDFLDMLRNGDLVDCRLSGTFVVVKRGRNFGVRLKHTPKYNEPRREYPVNRPIPDYE